MPKLTEEADAAQATVEAAAKAAADAEMEEARAAATAAMKAVLVRPDGTSLTLSEVKLAPVFSDEDVVVYSDGVLFLSVDVKDGQVTLVLKEDDGTFTRASGPLRSLADLGVALDEVKV